MKTCTRCKTKKPESEFGLRGTSGGRKPGALKSQCKSCRLRDKQQKYNSDPATFGPKRHKLNLKKYGLTPAQYDVLLAAQGGVCAICHKGCHTGKRLAVDHIHGSNPTVVRGLLCSTCNQVLGFFSDSPERFLSASEYLQKGAA